MDNEIITGAKTNGQFTIQYQTSGYGGVIPVIDGVKQPSLMFGYVTEKNSDANPVEENRIFISNKGKVSIVNKECGKWKLKADNGWYAQREIEFLNEDEMMTWNPIKYVFNVLRKQNIQDLVNILRHPIIEQIIKAGYPNVAHKICANNEIARNLRVYFGVEKEKRLPLYKLLGVNKYMLYKVNEYNDIPLSVIQEAKRLYGKFDISDLSDQSVNSVVSMFQDRWSTCRDFLPTRDVWYWRRHRDENYELTEEERAFLQRLIRLNQQNDTTTSLFRDTLRVYNGMINKPDINLMGFDGHQDLVRLHDELIQLAEVERRDRQAAYDAAEKKRLEQMSKKFEELQDERIEKFEFENDEWCIRVPKTLQEIKDEGLRLHHCVGGYVKDHAMGQTNIIFLRKKGKENSSFYTIEINADNRVVQIHGAHNRWLGNNPEAVPFVYTWLEKIGAKYDKKVLLNKGAGFGAGAENLGTEYLKLIA